ncbi:MAG: hypothetical protein QME60_03900 [Verrucomicrobiota bacterium]|nr:hypothetical protein [Verrucomicrobiota bacterium]
MTAQGTSERQDSYRDNRALLEEICQGCCQPGKYCTLKEILIRSPKDVRTMVQIKCIEKLKYERSAVAGADIGWQRASDIWILEGFAEAFARLHRAGMKVETIYAAVVKSVAGSGQAAPPVAAEPQPATLPNQPLVQPAAPAGIANPPAGPAPACPLTGTPHPPERSG